MKNQIIETETQRITIETFLQNSKGEFNWLYNFTDGGFNDVWAVTKKQAIEKAYSGAIPSSFRKATNETSEQQNKNGWMMTM